MEYLETDEGGWRMRRAHHLNKSYWLEDPVTPIGVVKEYVMKGGDEVKLDKTRPRLKKNRL